MSQLFHFVKNGNENNFLVRAQLRKKRRRNIIHGRPAIATATQSKRMIGLPENAWRWFIMTKKLKQITKSYTCFTF